MNKNSFVYIGIFMVVLTIVFVFPLALASKVTKPIADDFWRVERHIATLKSLGIQADREHFEEATAKYAALEKYTLDASGALKPVSDADIDRGEIRGAAVTPLYYVTSVDGETRYSGSFTGPGLWGNVTLAIGVNSDATRIEGMQILFQVETPGLGGRIGEPWFYGQFSGQKISQTAPLKFVLSNGIASKDLDDGAVDAITGATVTSNAVKYIVNDRAIPELKKLIQIKGGAQ
jgi:Na+-transporting NADH:ubiquinone oxidoreductase subunit C